MPKRELIDGLDGKLSQTSLEEKVEKLEKDLAKQKKISDALKERVKNSMRHSSSHYSMFESNILLQTETERRTQQLQAEKDYAERKNIEKSDFFSSMSHELKSPMHAIISFSAFGAKKYQDADRKKLGKYFDSIGTSAARLMRLIDDLLELAKLESGKFTVNIKPNNLVLITEKLIEENVELINSKKLNVKLINNNAPECVDLDQDRTIQIIQNLLSNAIKFTPELSQITIRCTAVEFEGAPAIQLSVIDQGEGIPSGEHELVFEKYIQSSNNSHKKGGTGLGLPICKELVKLHNGKIWVESNSDNEKNQGACFSFVIPIKYLDDPGC